MLVYFLLGIILLSFVVLAIIIRSKVGALKKLPEISSKESFVSLLLKNVKLPFGDKVSSEFLLHKALSKTRVLSLKVERKTGNWLNVLREKSLKKKTGNKDEYWKNIKKLSKDE